MSQTGQKLYNGYSGWIKRNFGCRVQKISVNAGFTCPNRDGTKSTGGCIYCDNNSFTPPYCNPAKSVSQQIEEGIKYFSAKYPAQKYIAYFQPFSNTYAPINVLCKLFEEVLSHKNVVGLSVSTRPDCIDEDSLVLLKNISQKYFVSIEYGVETTYDKTLAVLNRCHTYRDAVNAVILTNKYNLHICLHLILGLPGESGADFIKHAENISTLPFSSLKIHQLQILEGTRLGEMYKSGENIASSCGNGPHVFTVEEYIDVTVDFLEYLAPHIIIERFASESHGNRIIAPKWNGIKNYQITEMIKKRLKERETFQGRLYPAR